MECIKSLYSKIIFYGYMSNHVIAIFILKFKLYLHFTNLHTRSSGKIKNVGRRYGYFTVLELSP